MKRVLLTGVIAVAASLCMLAGCGQTAMAETSLPANEEVQSVVEEPDTELAEADDGYVDSATEFDPESAEFAVGTWYTDGYDVDGNWAMSYAIELYPDGGASCVGYRNQDSGYYEVVGDNEVLITFDYCETDTPDGGMQVVDDYVYYVTMTIDGDDAQIKVDAPDVISNLEDGAMYRGDAAATTGSVEPENVDLPDGEYFTEEVYKGEISPDGTMLTIDTALGHYDDQWQFVTDYEKASYTFPVAKNCQCVIYEEEKYESPFSEKMEFVSEMLEGNSGLPIQLIIKNNELVGMTFSP